MRPIRIPSLHHTVTSGGARTVTEDIKGHTQTNIARAQSSSSNEPHSFGAIGSVPTVRLRVRVRILRPSGYRCVSRFPRASDVHSITVSPSPTGICTEIMCTRTIGGQISGSGHTHELLRECCHNEIARVYYFYIIMNHKILEARAGDKTAVHNKCSRV